MMKTTGIRHLLEESSADDECKSGYCSCDITKPSERLIDFLCLLDSSQSFSHLLDFLAYPDLIVLSRRLSSSFTAELDRQIDAQSQTSKIRETFDAIAFLGPALCDLFESNSTQMKSHAIMRLIAPFPPALAPPGTHNHRYATIQPLSLLLASPPAVSKTFGWQKGKFIFITQQLLSDAVLYGLPRAIAAFPASLVTNNGCPTIPRDLITILRGGKLPDQFALTTSHIYKLILVPDPFALEAVLRFNSKHDKPLHADRASTATLTTTAFVNRCFGHLRCLADHGFLNRDVAAEQLLLFSFCDFVTYLSSGLPVPDEEVSTQALIRTSAEHITALLTARLFKPSAASLASFSKIYFFATAAYARIYHPVPVSDAEFLEVLPTIASREVKPRSDRQHRVFRNHTHIHRLLLEESPEDTRRVYAKECEAVADCIDEELKKADDAKREAEAAKIRAAAIAEWSSRHAAVSSAELEDVKARAAEMETKLAHLQAVEAKLKAAIETAAELDQVKAKAAELESKLAHLQAVEGKLKAAMDTSEDLAHRLSSKADNLKDVEAELQQARDMAKQSTQLAESQAAEMEKVHRELKQEKDYAHSVVVQLELANTAVRQLHHKEQQLQAEIQNLSDHRIDPGDMNHLQVELAKSQAAVQAQIALAQHWQKRYYEIEEKLGGIHKLLGIAPAPSPMAHVGPAVVSPHVPSPFPFSFQPPQPPPPQPTPQPAPIPPPATPQMIATSLQQSQSGGSSGAKIKPQFAQSQSQVVTQNGGRLPNRNCSPRSMSMPQQMMMPVGGAPPASLPTAAGA